jgi:hypothetical protein
MNYAIVEYVAEEVARQGHNPQTVDGLSRTSWMLKAWAVAIDESINGLHGEGLIASGRDPTVEDAITLGQIIEPVTNQMGIRKHNVQVGHRLCPPPFGLRASLDTLFTKIHQLSPMQFYYQFELIHPFGDGNGRTGKILLNWINGTLQNPIFPPNDLFGHPIRNP